MDIDLDKLGMAPATKEFVRKGMEKLSRHERQRLADGSQHGFGVIDRLTERAGKRRRKEGSERMAERAKSARQRLSHDVARQVELTLFDKERQQRKAERLERRLARQEQRAASPPETA